MPEHEWEMEEIDTKKDPSELLGIQQTFSSIEELQQVAKKKTGQITDELTRPKKKTRTKKTQPEPQPEGILLSTEDIEPLIRTLNCRNPSIVKSTCHVYIVLPTGTQSRVEWQIPKPIMDHIQDKLTND